MFFVAIVRTRTNLLSWTAWDPANKPEFKTVNLLITAPTRESAKERKPMLTKQPGECLQKGETTLLRRLVNMQERKVPQDTPTH